MKQFKDAGIITYQILALVIAIIMFVILALAGFGVLITLKDPTDLWGIAGLGLAAFAIAHLP